VTDTDEPWTFELKEPSNVLDSSILAVLYKIDRTDPSKLAQLDEVIHSVPSNGPAVASNGQTFTCKIWVMGVLVALHNPGIIVLKQSTSRSRIYTCF
jgi:hypothetical protein